jgi:hypothetical protein
MRCDVCDVFDEWVQTDRQRELDEKGQSNLFLTCQGHIFSIIYQELPPGIEIRTLLFYRWLYPRTKYKSRR